MGFWGESNEERARFLEGVRAQLGIDALIHTLDAARLVALDRNKWDKNTVWLEALLDGTQVAIIVLGYQRGTMIRAMRPDATLSARSFPFSSADIGTDWILDEPGVRLGELGPAFGPTPCVDGVVYAQSVRGKGRDLASVVGAVRAVLAISRRAWRPPR